MAEDEEALVGVEGDFVVRLTTTHHQIPRPPSTGAGPPTPADGTALTDTPRVSVKPARKTREPTFTPHQRPEPTTSEEGGDGHSPELFDML